MLFWAKAFTHLGHERLLYARLSKTSKKTIGKNRVGVN